MEALKKNYECTLSDRQAMALFDKEKPTHRGYTEHLNYLLQVNSAGGGHFDRNVLKSMVHRSGSDLIHEISSKYNRNRTDYIDHATELAEFADELWNDRTLDKSIAKTNRGGSIVNAVAPKRLELRDWYNCGRKGHLSKDCPASKKKSFEFGKKKQEKKEDEKDSFALNVCSLGYEQESKNVSYPPKIESILDYGCGRHNPITVE
jgi:hypothetical protein